MITNNEALATTIALSGKTKNDDHILSPFSFGYEPHDLSIEPSMIPADLDIHEVGDAIANNSSIKSIKLFHMQASNDQLKAMFDGITRSKSIRKITIERSMLDQDLSLVLHTPNVEVLELRDCTITAKTSASLRRCTHLRKITLISCSFRFNDKSVEEEFFESMKNSPLQSLSIDSTDICGDALVSVNELLSNRRSTLQELYLNYCCSGKDLLILASGLAGCQSLESLTTNDLKKYGWRSLFPLLMTPGSSLCKLDLSFCEMPDEVAVEFATYTSSLSSLRELNLSYIIENVSGDVLVEFFPKLLGANSALESLDLSQNRMQDGAVEALANALAENGTLERLTLSECVVTVEDWLAFSQALSSLNIDSALKYLDLSYNDFDDRAITALANALARNETLEELNVSCSIHVTPFGWATFAALLRTNSVITTLRLPFNNVAKDHLVVAFADALGENPTSSLKVLDFYEAPREVEITSAGWRAISNLLCDTSSIEGTKISNHSLCDLGLHVDDDDVKALLELNKSENKNQVARNKIIKSHFSGTFDVVAMTGDQNKLLPDSLSFFGKDELGLSALYTMLKSKSELMEGIN